MTTRYSRGGAFVRLARKDSMGLKGTYKNANHHAQECLAMLDILTAAVENAPLKEWIQAHNVHEVVTHDDRHYKVRPFREGGKYIGLQLFQAFGRGKANEVSVVKMRSQASAKIVALLIDVLAETPIPLKAVSAASSVNVDAGAVSA